MQFPVTAGTLPVTLAAGAYTGFLFKISSGASLVYATYLGEAYTYAGAMLVDAGEQVTLAGTGLTLPGQPVTGSTFLMRLARDASRIDNAIALPQVGSPTGLAADDEGNLLVAGRADRGPGFVTPGAYQGPQPSSVCTAKFPVGSDVYVSKFAAADWRPVYSALLRAACGMQPGAIAVDKTGAAVVALSGGAGMELRRPLLAGAACGENSSAVARLTADGTDLEFATYLDHCGVPGIALSGGGTLYAGVSPLYPARAAELLALNASAMAGRPDAVRLDGISNAFSGDASSLAVGGLYTLTGSGFGAPAIDLGLNASQDLPTRLGGIEVRFDGIAAPILQTGPGKIVVVAPPGPPPGRRNRAVAGFTAVQIVAQGVGSNVVWMPLADAVPGLLTTAFLTPQAASSGGYAHNQDGSVNDAAHPAAAGSTITLYVTGMGVAAPPPAPGSIARSTATTPVMPVYATWQRYNISSVPVPETVTSLPGYVSAVFQIPLAVPTAVETLGGAADANGVRQVPVGLQFAVAPSTTFPPASNLVWLYVK
jgi:uncharacterized protein (TIGR03437 family)